MRKISVLLFSIVSVPLIAQSVQEKIDQQIWIPFTQAWEADDGNAFNAIHSEDVRRINPGRMLVGQEYKSRNKERMNGQSGSKNRIIEFSFETRTNNGSFAYEVGYYRITDTSEATSKQFVGRFHVALEKINDQWKITQDWDTGEINGVRITPESVEKREFTHFQ